MAANCHIGDLELSRDKSLSLSLSHTRALWSHNLHSWCHGFPSESIWHPDEYNPHWTLSSSLIDKRKWGDWLIDCSMQIVILQSDGRLKCFGADMLWECFVVFACACCPFAKKRIAIMALGRRRSGWRWSCAEDAENGVISLVLRSPFWLLCEHWHFNLKSVETSAHLAVRHTEGLMAVQSATALVLIEKKKQSHRNNF